MFFLERSLLVAFLFFINVIHIVYSPGWRRRRTIEDDETADDAVGAGPARVELSLAELDVGSSAVCACK